MVEAAQVSLAAVFKQGIQLRIFSSEFAFFISRSLRWVGSCPTGTFPIVPVTNTRFLLSEANPLQQLQLLLPSALSAPLNPLQPLASPKCILFIPLGSLFSLLSLTVGPGSELGMVIMTAWARFCLEISSNKLVSYY